MKHHMPCASCDTMTRSIQLPEGLEVGDKLIITMTGAYTLVYGSAFNGFALPKIVFINEEPARTAHTNASVELVAA